MNYKKTKNWGNERTNSASNVIASESLKAVINDNYGLILELLRNKK